MVVTADAVERTPSRSPSLMKSVSCFNVRKKVRAATNLRVFESADLAGVCVGTMEAGEVAEIVQGASFSETTIRLKCLGRDCEGWVSFASDDDRHVLYPVVEVGSNVQTAVDGLKAELGDGPKIFLLGPRDWDTEQDETALRTLASHLSNWAQDGAILVTGCNDLTMQVLGQECRDDVRLINVLPNDGRVPAAGCVGEVLLVDGTAEKREQLCALLGDCYIGMNGADDSPAAHFASERGATVVGVNTFRDDNKTQNANDDEQRSTLITQIFTLLDNHPACGGPAGGLDARKMRLFAEQRGFAGNSAAWKTIFDEIRSALNCQEKSSLDLKNFKRSVDCEDFHVNTADLQKILTTLSRAIWSLAGNNNLAQKTSEGRDQLVEETFLLLDRDGNCKIGGNEMLVFARLTGFEGSERSWAPCFAELCACDGSSPRIGLSLAWWKNFVNNPSSLGYHSDGDLKTLREALRKDRKGLLANTGLGQKSAKSYFGYFTDTMHHEFQAVVPDPNRGPLKRTASVTTLPSGDLKIPARSRPRARTTSGTAKSLLNPSDQPKNMKSYTQNIHDLHERIRKLELDLAMGGQRLSVKEATNIQQNTQKTLLSPKNQRQSVIGRNSSDRWSQKPSLLSVVSASPVVASTTAFESIHSERFINSLQPISVNTEGFPSPTAAQETRRSSQNFIVAQETFRSTKKSDRTKSDVSAEIIHASETKPDVGASISCVERFTETHEEEKRLSEKSVHVEAKHLTESSFHVAGCQQANLPNSDRTRQEVQEWKWSCAALEGMQYTGNFDRDLHVEHSSLEMVEYSVAKLPTRHSEGLLHPDQYDGKMQEKQQDKLFSQTAPDVAKVEHVEGKWGETSKPDLTHKANFDSVFMEAKAPAARTPASIAPVSPPQPEYKVSSWSLASVEKKKEPARVDSNPQRNLQPLWKTTVASPIQMDEVIVSKWSKLEPSNSAHGNSFDACFMQTLLPKRSSMAHPAPVTLQEQSKGKWSLASISDAKHSTVADGTFQTDYVKRAIPTTSSAPVSKVDTLGKGELTTSSAPVSKVDTLGKGECSQPKVELGETQDFKYSAVDSTGIPHPVRQDTNFQQDSQRADASLVKSGKKNTSVNEVDGLFLDFCDLRKKENIEPKWSRWAHDNTGNMPNDTEMDTTFRSVSQAPGTAENGEIQPAAKPAECLQSKWSVHQSGGMQHGAMSDSGLQSVSSKRLSPGKNETQPELYMVALERTKKEKRDLELLRGQTAGLANANLPDSRFSMLQTTTNPSQTSEDALTIFNVKTQKTEKQASKVNTAHRTSQKTSRGEEHFLVDNTLLDSPVSLGMSFRCSPDESDVHPSKHLAWGEVIKATLVQDDWAEVKSKGEEPLYLPVKIRGTRVIFPLEPDAIKDSREGWLTSERSIGDHAEEKHWCVVTHGKFDIYSKPDKAELQQSIDLVPDTSVKASSESQFVLESANQAKKTFRAGCDVDNAAWVRVIRSCNTSARNANNSEVETTTPGSQSGKRAPSDTFHSEPEKRNGASTGHTQKSSLKKRNISKFASIDTGKTSDTLNAETGIYVVVNYSGTNVVAEPDTPWRSSQKMLPRGGEVDVIEAATVNGEQWLKSSSGSWCREFSANVRQVSKVVYEDVDAHLKNKTLVINPRLTKSLPMYPSACSGRERAGEALPGSEVTVVQQARVLMPTSNSSSAETWRVFQKISINDSQSKEGWIAATLPTSDPALESVNKEDINGKWVLVMGDDQPIYANPGYASKTNSLLTRGSLKKVQESRSTRHLQFFKLHSHDGWVNERDEKGKRSCELVSREQHRYIYNVVAPGGVEAQELPTRDNRVKGISKASCNTKVIVTEKVVHANGDTWFRVKTPIVGWVTEKSVRTGALKVERVGPASDDKEEGGSLKSGKDTKLSDSRSQNDSQKDTKLSDSRPATTSRTQTSTTTLTVISSGIRANSPSKSGVGLKVKNNASGQPVVEITGPSSSGKRSGKSSK